MNHIPPEKTLQDWLTSIERIHPMTIDMGLARVKQVAKRMACDTFKCPVITVGGTNGKGSTVAMLEAIYCAAGLKTGAYTSPHLLRFNERVRLNGIDVSDALLCESFKRIEKARDGISLTYFEFATLAALDIFQRSNCDVVILEVGLGGRLDATNLVDSDISVITTIAIDHIDYLGDTRELIAFEKAGIMREDRPCVCGDREPPESLLNYAHEMDVSLRVLGWDFSYTQDAEYWSFTHSFEASEVTFTLLPYPDIELQNAATALQTALELRPRLPFTQAQLEIALKKVKVIGRFQRIEVQGVPHYFDVAHNPAAAACLARRLAIEPCRGRTIAVWSMLGDKDIEGSVLPLVPHIDMWFCAPLEVPRAATRECLEAALAELDARIYSRLEDAYHSALEVVQPHDRLLIFGSFHTVATVMLLIL